MEYTLMHKNTAVVDLVITDGAGVITKLLKTHDERHLPIGVHVFKSGVDRKTLNDWWLGRSIPASRAGIDFALQQVGVSTPAYLLEKCYGLSLSDQYWICPMGSGLCWENINFFTNGFSKDMGEVLFGREPGDLGEPGDSGNPGQLNLMSPDNTTDGWLRKKWIIADGKRILMKSGSDVYQQEPFNEVIASNVMCRLDINHVSYTLATDSGKLYSLCENFVTQETELVPAWRIIASMKKSNQNSDFTHFLWCCDKLGIENAEYDVAKMLTVDYIIANEDRHYNNFGFVRNAETLEWIGLAPVYDSGSSLWYNTARVGCPVESKPFKKTHDEQIKLVTDLKWFDFNAITGTEEEIRKVLEKSDDLDNQRICAIARLVFERAYQIKQMSKNVS